ncbi:MAG TPA: permease [Desulfomonilia bacterium]|nr:permease [Desulfomonilia bacterium]
MNWNDEWKWLAGLAGAFLVLFYLPVGLPRFDNAVLEGLYLARSYAQEHVILCLLPAFFIAGAIGVFLSQNTVMKYLGADAKKVLAYGVASVSGTILAVCSCTILPLFAGIYRMGAGLGPAVAFLYSGPAINVLAIILTARILGIELGIARAVGAIAFSVIIGLIMHVIYRKEKEGQDGPKMMLGGENGMRPLWQNVLYFAAMIAVLVFANWGRPQDETGFWHLVYASKWIITSFSAAGLGVMLVAWFAVPVLKVVAVAAITAVFSLAFPHTPMVGFMVGVIGLSYLTSTQEGEMQEWFGGSWGFAKQIMPILFAGVLVAGFLLGRPGHEGIIPSVWVSSLVGGNSLSANFIASVAGAFMYFATLTEVPILQGLMGSGMGKGPALALLLAGPAVSLPNMLVIRSVIGTGKTVVYVTLVIVMATISGFLYGAVF